MDGCRHLQYPLQEGPTGGEQRIGILAQAGRIDSLEARVRAFSRRKNRADAIWDPASARPAFGVILFAKHVRAATAFRNSSAPELEKKIGARLRLRAGRRRNGSTAWKTPGRRGRTDRTDSSRRTGSHSQIPRAGRLAHPERRCNPSEIELETGAPTDSSQASSRGYDSGDSQTGSTNVGEQFSDERLTIALHSRKISFDHPMTRERVALPLPCRKPDLPHH